jgi:hypothetical protein
MDKINDPMFKFWTEFFMAQFKVGKSYKGYEFISHTENEEYVDFKFRKGKFIVISSLDLNLGNTTIEVLNNEIISDYDGDSVNFLLDLLDYD